MLHCCGKKLLMKSKSWLTIITSSQVEWEGVSFQAGLKSFSSISLSLSLALSLLLPASVALLQTEI